MTSVRGLSSASALPSKSPQPPTTTTKGGGGLLRRLRRSQASLINTVLFVLLVVSGSLLIAAAAEYMQNIVQPISSALDEAQGTWWGPMPPSQIPPSQAALAGCRLPMRTA